MEPGFEGTAEQLVEALEATALTPEQWRHADHVRAAFVYVDRIGPDAALARMRPALRKLLVSFGAAPTHYHETLTRAWLEVVHRALEDEDGARDTICERFLAGSDKRHLFHFYDGETLMSDAAREGFVAPDRAPLETPRAMRAQDAVVLRWATEEDLEDVRSLFRAYADGLGVDLGFQGFEAELRDLPGKYDRPRGRLLVAVSDRPVACAALRPHDQRTAEIKRVYVTPEARGRGLARRLSRALLTAARNAGFDAVLLDTLERLAPAVKLYESLGFVRTEPYAPNPEADVLYLRRAVR